MRINPAIKKLVNAKVSCHVNESPNSAIKSYQNPVLPFQNKIA